MSDMQAQCWICPFCFDDRGEGGTHRECSDKAVAALRAAEGENRRWTILIHDLQTENEMLRKANLAGKPAFLREVDIEAKQRAEAAEAELIRIRCAADALYNHLLCPSQTDDPTRSALASHGYDLEAADAREAVLATILRDWLKAFEDCGGDNGPSFTERACAERARQALGKNDGT